MDVLDFSFYYDPDSCQYLSPDPIVMTGGIRPQAYVHNPMERVDPLGQAGHPMEEGIANKTVTNSAGAQVNHKLVKDQDELLAEAHRAAGGSLGNFTNYKPDWWKSPDGQRRIEWNPNGHENVNEGPHVTVRDFNGKDTALQKKSLLKGGKNLHDKS